MPSKKIMKHYGQLDTRASKGTLRPAGTTPSKKKEHYGQLGACVEHWQLLPYRQLYIMQARFLVPVISMCLMSCGATKQYVAYTHDKPLEKGSGRIYVVKPSFYGGGVRVSVFCDDVLVGNTRNGSYLCWDMPVGIHTIGNTQNVHAGATLGAAAGEDIVRIDVKDGGVYYVKMWPRTGGMDFKILSAKEGKQNIEGRKTPKLNYID